MLRIFGSVPFMLAASATVAVALTDAALTEVILPPSNTSSITAWAPGSVSHGQSGLEQPFNGARFLPAEAKMLQIALAAAGTYSGPIDGIWSDESQRAIETYAAAEFGEPALDLHAAALMITLYSDMEARGWVQRRLPDLGLSLALPEAVLDAPEPENDGQRWWSRTGSLTLLTSRIDPDMTRAWHAAASAANAAPDALETVRTETLLFTAGDLDDGRHFFTRSELVDGNWSTIYVASGSDEADMLNLIRVSIATGTPDPWDIPPGGALDDLVREAVDLIEEPAQAFDFFPPASGIAPEDQEPATGTGFYVGPTTIVTASHVIQGCRAISLADGSPLSLIALDQELDVAVLATSARSDTWLTLSDTKHARLGQSVHAAGFPYYNIAGTSLHLTGGNVSSLADINDDPRFFSFSAPVQPGNSGGPLVGHDGRVVGLVVSRLSERYIAEATGTLPQNINYALGSPDLSRFLSSHGATIDQPGLSFALDEGAPAGFDTAIVPVLCD